MVLPRSPRATAVLGWLGKPSLPPPPGLHGDTNGFLSSTELEKIDMLVGTKLSSEEKNGMLEALSAYDSDVSFSDFGKW
jgi:hypothetical protein